MTTKKFRRSRVAASWRHFAGARSGSGVRDRISIEREQRERPRQRICRRRGVTDDAAMWCNPAALSKFPRCRGGRAGHHHAVDQVPQRRLAPALNQPLGNNGGDAGGNNFVPNMYFSCRSTRSGLRRRRQRAVRTEDRVRRRLARPLPGLKSEVKTINVNPAIVVASAAAILRRRRRRTAAHRRHVHEQHQLLGSACCRPPARPRD